MATANYILAQAIQEGAKLILIYDDVTLLGTGIEITAPVDLQKTCTATVELADGTILTRVITPNLYNTVTSIPNPRRPQGVVTTSQWGLNYIKWPINKAGLSF
jgi:predicted phage tail protein